MLKKCIGIISYLPEDTYLRISRKNKLIRLITKCNKIFDLPILLISQCYKGETLPFTNIIYHSYETPLSISVAREKLREAFLESDYDVIILLDDDCKIRGESAEKYLQEIDEHPGMFYEKAKSLHKLMAFSKEAYKLQAYDTENTPEKRIAYEDRIYFWTLVGNHRELHYRFSNDVGLEETSVANFDNESSWSKGLSKTKMAEMSMKTDKIIEERTGKTIKDLYNSIGHYHN